MRRRNQVMWKVSHSSALRLTLFLFFWVFFSFGNDTKRNSSPSMGVWLTRESSLSGVFHQNHHATRTLPSTVKSSQRRCTPPGPGGRRLRALAARYRSWDAKPQREQKQVWTPHEGRTEAHRGTWDVCKMFVLSLLWLASLNRPGAVSAALNWSHLL